MPDARVCSLCGAELGAITEGLICPSCLIQAALADAATVSETPVPDTKADRQMHAWPDRVGAYQILRPLGEGGMGVVYLAEQAAPIRRQVALKLVKLGMDTREVVSRFDAERQALALMDHPNIASVFDAGVTDDGRPYFVMEYVPGVPITEFADVHQLSTQKRLELFQQVCAGVQHAHQKGVIHRDLKPSNVLVMEQDGKPMPKVIDFGIAKATNQHLTERTQFTEKGVLIGTPEYMSPEQADSTAADVDTRTDIYSLGMILYELLVGGLPFSPAQLRQAGYAEIQRIIREEEPVKPSTKLSSLGATAADVAARHRTTLSALTRDLRGDLDWITLKAIEKDRNRRYASASELAADLGRHLHHEPVAAGPPRASYRLQKFVRKHRGAVAAWGALLLLLTAGLVVSATLYVRAERARQDANRQRAVAEIQRTAAQVASQDADEQRQVAQDQRAAADVQRNAAEIDRDEALYQSYRSALMAADLSLKASEVAQARQRLQETDPRFRGWEWRYLMRMADSSLVATRAFSFDVREVRFSRNGDALLARSEDVFPGSARGVQGGARGRPPELSVTRVTAAPVPALSRLRLGERVVAISPDGTRVLSAGWHSGDFPPVCHDDDDQEAGVIVCGPGPGYVPAPRAAPSPAERDRLVVRDTTTGNLVATLMHPNLGVWTIKRMAGASLFVGSTIRPGVNSVIVAPSRVPLAMLSAQFPDVVDAAFSSNGSRLATWSWDNVIYVWDVERQSLLSTLRGHRDGIRSVCFDPTMDRIVSTSFDGTMHLWTVQDGAQVQELRIPGVSTAAFSPSGANIAAGTDGGSIQIWDAFAGRLARVLTGYTAPIASLVFSPDSMRLASSAFDDPTARLWDVSTGVQLLSFAGHSKGVRSVAFRPDGNVIATGSKDGTVRFWNARSPVSVLSGHTAEVPALGFASPGGDVVSASIDGTVRVWDPRSGQSNLLALDRGQRTLLPPYFGLAMRPPRVAVPAPSVFVNSDGVTQKRSKVLDIQSGTTVVEVVHEPAESQIAISPDGTRLVVGTRSGTGGVIRVWKIPTGRPTATWTLKGLWPLGYPPAFSRAGRIAVSADAPSPSNPGAARGQVLILQEGSAIPVATISTPFLPGHPVFLPDEAGVIYADGPNMHIWDFQLHADVATLSGHGDYPPVILVSPDGTRIFSGGDDQTVRIWDTVRRQLLLTLRLRSSVTSLAVSQDGSLVAAGLIDGSIQLFDANAAPSLGTRHQ